MDEEDKKQTAPPTQAAQLSAIDAERAAMQALLSDQTRQAALAALQRVGVKIDHEMAGLAFTRLSAIASEFQLSVYDAAYFELAQRRKLPLACKDGPLRAAATRAKIDVL